MSVLTGIWDTDHEPHIPPPLGAGMEWLGHWLEVLLEAAVQLSGAQDVNGALITAAVFGAWWVWSWNRRQRREGKIGLQPHHLILFGLIGGALCLALAAGGYAWLQWFYDESNFEYDNCYHPINGEVIAYAKWPDRDLVHASLLGDDQ